VGINPKGSSLSLSLSSSLQVKPALPGNLGSLCKDNTHHPNPRNFQLI